MALTPVLAGGVQEKVGAALVGDVPFAVEPLMVTAPSGPPLRSAGDATLCGSLRADVSAVRAAFALPWSDGSPIRLRFPFSSRRVQAPPSFAGGPAKHETNSLLCVSGQPKMACASAAHAISSTPVWSSLMRHIRLTLVAAVISLTAASLPASAQITLVPGTINMFRDVRGANDVGVNTGDVLQYGADISGGSLGVSMGAKSATGFVDPAFPCSPLAINANFCANSTPYDTTRLDPWTIQFTRGAQSLDATGPSVAAAAGSPIPFPTSVTLSGAGVTPTISWQLPVGFAPDAFRVNVFDKGGPRGANGVAEQIFSTAIPSNATSFTLPASLGLSSTGNYVINFQVIETRGHGPLVGNNNALILSRSNSYFDFAPLTGSVPHDVALPTIDASGVYHFNVGGVGPDHITFIDPLLAIGYHYHTGTGDPNFRSVLLPNVGDGLYSLSFVDGLGSHTVSLQHDLQFFFGSGGVDDFTVTGIEESAALDPSNPTAFVTGLTFSANGDFTGTMTPLTVSVNAVPEPESYALMLAGLGILGMIARRRRTDAHGSAPARGAHVARFETPIPAGENGSPTF